MCDTRANTFRFFSVKISLKTTCLEEKIHHKVEKSKYGRKNEALYWNLFDLAVEPAPKLKF
jgi:hypothetical protein